MTPHGEGCINNILIGGEEEKAIFVVVILFTFSYYSRTRINFILLKNVFFFLLLREHCDVSVELGGRVGKILVA